MIWRLSILPLSFIFLFIGIASTATFNVNSTSDVPDSVPGNGICATTTGSCTLRAAVMETVALGGVDHINVPAGTYILTIPGTGENFGTTGDLDLDSVNLVGTGTVIVDGGGIDRVFDIYNSSSLRGIIVQNGNTFEHGAGILCNFDCTLDDVTVRTNTTTGWGGGIRNVGTLLINNSTIHSNHCGTHGAGISNYGGTLTAYNTTISGNKADFDSGGIDNDGLGTTNLINTTITNNISDNNNDGMGNAGGIKIFWGNVYMWNTIVANNIDQGGEAPDCQNTLSSQGYNLVRDLTSCTIVGDIEGNIYSIDPGLGSLGNYGGQTLTHALMLGSPAIDAASNGACPTEDQRGVLRPQGLTCDMGSYEFESSFLYTDNFEDGDASDWTPNRGNWTISDGDLEGSHNRSATNISPFIGCGVGCTVAGYIQINNLNARVSLLAFYQDKRNVVEVTLMQDKQRIILKQRRNGQVIAKQKYSMPISVGIDYPVLVRQLSGILEVEMDGGLIMSVPTSSPSIGGVGFRVKSTTGTSISGSFEEIFVY